MDKAAFNKLIVEIFLYFQSQKMPSDQQASMWFDVVQHVPSSAIPELKRIIFKSYDNCPRNISKAITEAYNTVPQSSSFKQHDPVEDHRFPVSKLHDALKILEEKGEAAFYAYANAVNMPRNDRDRVKYKHQIILGNVTVKPLVYKEAQDTIPF